MLQSAKSNSSSYLRLETGFLCGSVLVGGGRERRRQKKKKNCCRVIFRLNVPLHNNLHKQPCICDKKIGNFQRLCRDWELKASLCYLLSCSWSPQIPSLLSYISPKARLINFLSLPQFALSFSIQSLGADFHSVLSQACSVIQRKQENKSGKKGTKTALGDNTTVAPFRSLSLFLMLRWGSEVEMESADIHRVRKRKGKWLKDKKKADGVKCRREERKGKGKWIFSLSMYPI